MGTYLESGEPFLLALALSIGILSAYSLFCMISYVNDRSMMRWYAALGAAALYALGMTVMHLLIQMSSDHLVGLDWGIASAYLVALLLVFTCIQVARAAQVNPARLLVCSLLITLSHLILHYWQLLSASYRGYTLHLVLAAAALLIHLGGCMLAYRVYWRNEGSNLLPSAVLMGSSATVLHILSVEALTMEYDHIMTADLLSDQLRVLAGGMGVVTMLILSVFLMIVLIRKRLGQVDEQYKLLVENSLDMIAIVQKGNWVYINRSGLRLLEANHANELLGMPVWSRLHSRHHLEMTEQLMMGQEESGRMPQEQEWLSLKGKPLHTEVITNPTHLGGRPATQLIVRDISERKKNEELLINSEKLYVAGELAAGIAHEIRNPLTSLKGFLQLISTGRTDQGRYYDIMKSELTRIESIVSELLMLSKPQLVELKCCDARQIMKESLAILAPQANLYNIIFQVDYGEAPLWLRCVEDQIKQVMINVLKNAIEVMPEGGIIRIACTLADSLVQVRIEDEGPGLNEEQLAKMGQPFYTTKDRGTGLGLMVSYKIIDNHKGSIVMSSEVGSGTVCDIRLPYATEGAVMAETFQPDNS